MRSSFCVLSIAVLTFTLASASPDADGMAQEARKPATVPAEIAVSVGQSSYQAKGPATCTHAPRAGIYGIPAEMWSVRHQEAGRSLQLTFWKPSDGSASMFSFSANGPAKSTASTVRGGQPSGSGTVALASEGKGGTFTLDGKDKAGQAIKGTIKCEAFTPARAEGGN